MGERRNLLNYNGFIIVAVLISSNINHWVFHSGSLFFIYINTRCDYLITADVLSRLGESLLCDLHECSMQERITNQFGNAIICDSIL